MRGRRVGEGGYDGEESYGRGIIIFLFEGRSILRRRIYFCGRFFCGDLWCEEFGFRGFWLIRSRGHRFAGGFGHGGQDMLMVS